MNCKLLSIIVIIIIIIILINCYEGFDASINNFVDAFNNKNVKVDKLEISDEINTNKLNVSSSLTYNSTELINIIYPVGSIWLSSNKYDLNDKEKLKDTPLYYGNWELLNNDSYNVIGLTKNNEESKFTGTNTLSASQLPNHSHKGLRSEDSREPTGYGEGKRVIWATNASGSENNFNSYTYTGNDVGYHNGSTGGFTDYSDSDKTIIPKGYYLFAYKKLEL